MPNSCHSQPLKMKSEMLESSRNPRRKPTSSVEENVEKTDVCCGASPTSTVQLPVNGPTPRQTPPARITTHAATSRMRSLTSSSLSLDPPSDPPWMGASPGPIFPLTLTDGRRRPPLSPTGEEGTCLTSRQSARPRAAKAGTRERVAGGSPRGRVDSRHAAIRDSRP